MDLEMVPCPLCQQTRSFLDVAITAEDLHIRKYGSIYGSATKSEWKICGQCGFVHQNPRPSAEALDRFYMQSQYHAAIKDVSSEQRLEFARWYFGEKVEFACTHAKLERGSVFDIGCGQGEVLKLCEERGWKAYGVEPDENLADYAINVFGLSGVKRGILDKNFVLQEKVDLVFTNHAFEHFAKLDEVISGIKNILKINGYLFIAIPTYYKNKSSLSKAWMNSSHYSLFTHKSLGNLLVQHGFEEVAYTYNGWKKEVDDLWYLARYTGKSGESAKYFENPRDVYRYLHFTNPLRSFFFYPVYSNWTARVRIYTMLARALRLLVTSPSLFFKKVVDRIA